MPRTLKLLAAAAATLALTAAPARAIEPGVAQSANFSSNEAEITQDMGARWVRLFARYSQGCPLPPAEKNRLDAYQARGVNVLVVGIGSPAGDISPPANPQDYASWMACLGKTYGEGIDAFEVWNEPDEHAFWPSGPNPGAYTALLKATHAALKAVRPDAPVLVGGLTGNNFEFLEKLYDAGAQGSFDAVGVHTDTACLVRSPDFYYREPDGRIGRYAFTGYREVRHVMAARGDAKPIWMTEIGWSTLTTKCAHPGVTEDRPSGVSLEKQAEFLKRAYACAAADPYVGPVIWFSQRDAGTGNQYDHHLGLMDHAGTPKPAFDAYRGLFGPGGGGVAPDPGCGAKLDKDAPSVSLDVPGQYYSRLVVRGAASDPTTPISRIELWVDGKRVEGANQNGGTYDLDWFGSTKLGYGKHTVQLRAYDEALNVGRATAEVVRIDPSDPSSADRTAAARLKFKAERAKGGKIKVRARVLRALTGNFTEQPRGRLRIFFDRKAGRKWKRTSRYTKGIATPIKLKYKPRRGGTWRVRGKLALDAPYKNARTKAYVFRMR